MSLDAMKQALEALEDAVSAWRSEMEFRSCIDAAEPWAKAAESLRAAIPLMSIDVMKQALAVLDDYEPNEAHKVATALRAAIEQAQEPVAWLVQYPNKHEFVWGERPQWIAGAIGIEPLYTTPRQWKELTNEEIEQMMDYWSEDARSAYGGAHRANGEYVYIPDIIRDAEKRLKEKNT